MARAIQEADYKVDARNPRVRLRIKLTGECCTEMIPVEANYVEER
jgi:hypothetical protein